MLLIRAMITASFSQLFLSRYSALLWLGPSGRTLRGACYLNTPIWTPPTLHLRPPVHDPETLLCSWGSQDSLGPSCQFQLRAAEGG